MRDRAAGENNIPPSLLVHLAMESDKSFHGRSLCPSNVVEIQKMDGTNQIDNSNKQSCNIIIIIWVMDFVAMLMTVSLSGQIVSRVEGQLMAQIHDHMRAATSDDRQSWGNVLSVDNEPQPNARMFPEGPERLPF